MNEAEVSGERRTYFSSGFPPLFAASSMLCGEMPHLSRSSCINTEQLVVYHMLSFARGGWWQRASLAAARMLCREIQHARTTLTRHTEKLCGWIPGSSAGGYRTCLRPRLSAYVSGMACFTCSAAVGGRGRILDVV